jgi:hypothetical protein
MDTTTYNELCKRCVQYMLRHNDIETIRFNIEQLTEDLAQLEKEQHDDGTRIYELSGQSDGFVIRLDKDVQQQAVNHYYRFEPMKLPYGSTGERYNVDDDALISFTNGNVGWSTWYFSDVEVLKPNKEN